MSESAQKKLFDRASLRALLLPLLLEQFLAVSMGMADTIMVSSVGEAAISGVSLVDGVNTLILQVLAALATGGAVIASQYLGRRDAKNARRAASQLYFTLIVSTVTAALLVMALCRPMLRAVFGAIDEDVMRFAQTYFFISAVSYPFMGIYNAGAALFRAQGNSRISMYASLVMNVINIVGNAVLIFVFHMGVLGAALATLLGRVFAAVWVTWQLECSDNPMRIARLRDLLPDGELIRRILSIGIPSGLENGVFHIGKLLVSSLVSTLGTAAIAANAVAGTLGGMANIPGNAVSLAMIPVVGRCLGAGEKAQARENAGLLMRVAYAGIAAACLLLFAVTPWAVRMFNLSPEAVTIATTVIRSFCVVSIFLWPASFTLPNALRAGGDARFTMTVSMISMWLFRVIACWVFVKVWGMGLLSVWVGMYIDWGFRVLLFALRYRSNRWMEHVVI